MIIGTVGIGIVNREPGLEGCEGCEGWGFPTPPGDERTEGGKAVGEAPTPGFVAIELDKEEEAGGIAAAVAPCISSAHVGSACRATAFRIVSRGTNPSALIMDMRSTVRIM